MGVGPGCVATCGIGYSPRQLEAICQYPIRAVLFDVEPEAQQRAEKLCRQLAAMPGQTENVVLETGTDPAEADPEEIQEIREKYLDVAVTSI